MEILLLAAEIVVLSETKDTKQKTRHKTTVNGFSLDQLARVTEEIGEATFTCFHCDGDGEEPGAPDYDDGRLNCFVCDGKGRLGPRKALAYMRDAREEYA